MTNTYNDELFPDDFEEIAKAYSNSLKGKDFVFVNLKKEEFNLLLDEIFVIIGKMKSCIKAIKTHFECKKLQERLESASSLLLQNFENKKPHNFKCVADQNTAFLSLISLENTLILKLMSLSIKSDKFELCNDLISSIAGVFAQSFSLDGFMPISS